MQNRSRDLTKQKDFVGIRLQGTKCNRDAIGATVELELQQKQHRLIQSVTAGDAFLSQSSKVLHFGIGNDKITGRAQVTWPGGSREVFTGLSAGNHYTLQQSQGVAVQRSRKQRVQLSDNLTANPPSTAAARVVLPGKISMPTIDWFDPKGRSVPSPLQGNAKPSLLVLWTSSCPNCQKQLAEFQQRQTEIESCGLHIVTLNLDRVDDLKSNAPADFTGYTTNAETLTRIRHFQNSMFDKVPPFVVPMSFLIDADMQLVALYRGAYGVDTFLHDVDLTQMEAIDLRNQAVPFAGTWFTKPATRSEFAEFVGKRVFAQDQHEGLRFLQVAMDLAQDQRKASLRRQLANTHHELAKAFGMRNIHDRAHEHFEKALQFAPQNQQYLIKYDFGVFFLRNKQPDKAIAQFEKTLKLSPNYAPAKQALESARSATNR